MQRSRSRNACAQGRHDPCNPVLLREGGERCAPERAILRENNELHARVERGEPCAACIDMPCRVVEFL